MKTAIDLNGSPTQVEDNVPVVTRNGVHHLLTEKDKLEQQQRAADWEAKKAENAKTNYLKERAREYPSTREQLDMMYNDKINGTTTWADALTAVKKKHPKPTN